MSNEPENEETAETLDEKKSFINDLMSALGFTFASGVGFWLSLSALITGVLPIKYEAMATAADAPFMYWGGILFGLVMGVLFGIAAFAYWKFLWQEHRRKPD